MKALARSLKEAPNAVPYGDIIVDLLDSIFDALKYCSWRYLHRKSFEATDPALRKCFARFNPSPHSRRKSRPNPHLLEGIGREGAAPRLAALTVWRFKEIQRNARYSKNEGVVGLMLPSPLSILCEALTVPNEPASRAFALAACRRLLFIRLRAYPSRQATGAGWKHLDVDDIESELESQRRYFEHRDNIPTATNLTAEVLQQFFAMKGHYCFRFGSWKKKNLGDRTALWQLLDAYLSQRDLTGQVRFRDTVGPAFEFRHSPLIIDRLRALDIINEIVGIPIPIRGADTLFFGGLRPSADNSLVINVSGSAGTGKTSFALAIAATLAPLGTRCYYITTEEATEDLKGRLNSLIPAYIRDLSIYKANINDWFHVADLRCLKSQAEGLQLGDQLSSHLEKIGRLVRETKDAVARRLMNKTSIPAIAPLIVVIDSFFGLTEGRDPYELKTLANFIDKCRDLKALVFVLSGEDLPRHSRLSYMVDVLMKVSYRNTDSEGKKPERLLQLVKTRFQLSRPGTHVFHMSGHEGFRISPQLPSQLDREEQRNLTLPDQDQVINALNDWSDDVFPCACPWARQLR
jgi:KaiC/GvpD/RAD55 family RecA-like ATPase